MKQRQILSVEEYFQLEENDPDTRYEYIDGYVYAMAGGTANPTLSNQISKGFSGIFCVGATAACIVPI